MTGSGYQETIDAIVQLADEIARVSPESAEKAVRIVELLRTLDPVEPDRGRIQDALETQALDDLSDAGLRNATESVVRTIRNNG